MFKRKLLRAYGWLFSFLVFVIFSCSVEKRNFTPEKKYSAKQLKEDFSTLEAILHHSHPGLYWYASKDSVDGYFKSAFADLNDSLTEQQFRNKISYAVSKIHCGHTSVRPSKKYAAYFTKNKTPQFPLSLKLWKDSALVTQNIIKSDSVLKRGTIIKSINGRSLTFIRDSIFQLIGTDGYANVFKFQAVSNNFPGYYKNAFGIDSEYAIKYVDTLGYENVAFIKNYFPKKDSVVEKLLQDTITKRQRKIQELAFKRSIIIDTMLHTAIMPVNTFSEGKLGKFFRRSFKKIREEKVENLIIDLRINTGGDVQACTKLLQYLTDQPFIVADTVIANSKTFILKKNIKPWFIYWLSMLVSGRRYKDNTIHFRYFEKHIYQLKKQNHFDGKIYLITGGLTFSGATLVAGKLKGQQNVTIVGEETGGGYYGNNAIFLPTITLPNTGIRVTLPLYRVVWDSTRIKNGRGVFPDVEVRPNAIQLKKGIDVKMEKAKSIIKKNWEKH